MASTKKFQYVPKANRASPSPSPSPSSSSSSSSSSSYTHSTHPPKAPSTPIVFDKPSNYTLSEEDATKEPFSFPSDPHLQMLQIDDECSVAWNPCYLTPAECEALYDHCLNSLNYEHSTYKIGERVVQIPRIQSWFADEGIVAPELYQKQKQHPWTPIMQKLKAQLEKQLGCTFVYCLVNLYRDGKDHIGFHSDNEVKGTVASVSIGATRTFYLKHLSEFQKNKTKEGKPLTQVGDKSVYEFKLVAGSMVAMLGSTQLYWKHGIPKELEVRDKRINLTFRTW